MKISWLLMAIAVLVTAVRYVRPQDAPRALPEVTSHENPVYPPLARQARIRGLVRLRITTDGHAVTDVAVLDGHPLLVKAATDNVQTWKFADHIPGTFEVTFKFSSLDNKTTFLQEPGVLDIAVLPPQYNENSDDRLDYTFPISWDLELKTATDDIKAPLTMWTYGPWLRGYTLGIQNQERGLGNAHIDGDMLGFESVLDDSRGQRLRFSLIGTTIRMANDRPTKVFLIGRRSSDTTIRGVFLDDSGTTGTWSAHVISPTSR